MVGAGIYVLTGTVAKDIAGPAIVLSYDLLFNTLRLSII